MLSIRWMCPEKPRSQRGGRASALPTSHQTPATSATQYSVLRPGSPSSGMGQRLLQDLRPGQANFLSLMLHRELSPQGVHSGPE